MLVSVTKYPDDPIVVVTYRAPFAPREDITQAQEQIASILGESQAVLFRIDDLSDVDMTWNQFVEGIYVGTREVPGSMVDSRIRGILVGNGEMVKLASESMKQEQYGATNTPVFTSLEAALAYARSNPG